MNYPNRSVDPGNQERGGAMQIYYYILHGFSSSQLNLVNLLEDENDIVLTRNLWSKFLPRSRIDTSISSDYQYDMIIRNYYSEDLVSHPNKLENIYETIMSFFPCVKMGGMIIIEGILGDRVNFIHSTMSSLYLHPELCKVKIFILYFK